MTVRTITSPYDPETLTEIQTNIAREVGIAWANLDSDVQTHFSRIIDNSAEYLSKRFGHEPWCIYIESLSLAAGTATLSMSYAVRQVVTIKETYDGVTRVVKPTTQREAFLRWGSGAATDPWTAQTDPHWMLDGMSDDNPPKQQWKRIPTPDKAVTGEALCRPYLTLRSASGDAQYVHLPANASVAMMDYILQKVAKATGNWQAMQIHKASLEDEIAALQVADNPEGAWETSREIGYHPAFLTEMDP